MSEIFEKKVDSKISVNLLSESNIEIMNFSNYLYEKVNRKGFSNDQTFMRDIIISTFLKSSTYDFNE